MITDDEAEKAVDYLRDQATTAAQARANREYLSEYRKSLKALLMQERPLDPLGAQERYAYSHPNYIAHLDALKQAVFEDEKARYLMNAAEVKIDCWRSMSANSRAKI